MKIIYKGFKYLVILIAMLSFVSCTKKTNTIQESIDKLTSIETTEDTKKTEITANTTSNTTAKSSTTKEETTTAETTAITTAETTAETTAPTTAKQTTTVVETTTTTAPTTVKPTTKVVEPTETPTTTKTVVDNSDITSITPITSVPGYTDVKTTSYTGTLDPTVTKSELNQVNSKADTIIAAIITTSMSDYQKVKAIHDYLVNNVDYDYENLTNNTLPDYVYTPAGALIYESAVCQGYAEAFCVLAHKAGIYCRMATGTADGISHAWNIVKIGNYWYHVDATYDDPLMNGSVVTDGSNISYEYFLLSDSELASRGSHIVEDQDYACTSSAFSEIRRTLTINKYMIGSYIIVNNTDSAEYFITDFVKKGKYEFNIIFDYTGKSSTTVRTSFGQIISSAITAGFEGKEGYKGYSATYTTMDHEGVKYLVFHVSITLK